MTRERTIAALERNRDELHRLGVRRLDLFGSVARGEAGSTSDVDIAVELKREYRGLDRIAQLEVIAARLRQMLRRRVDVIETPAGGTRFAAAFQRERIRAL
ncbi:MAG: nucleotidyltransferase domain-containing protein [Proteobacteria bacterium]|nr:nucleotidyltransferase domain-containing protein [Pseudomonadota bacterium]